LNARSGLFFSVYKSRHNWSCLTSGLADHNPLIVYFDSPYNGRVFNQAIPYLICISSGRLPSAEFSLLLYFTPESVKQRKRPSLNYRLKFFFSYTRVRAAVMVGNSLSLLDRIRALRRSLMSRPQVALYDQILLFGDSITEFSESQKDGFGFAPAVRDGKLLLPVVFLIISHLVYEASLTFSPRLLLF
jgi:hypothetical protein